MTAQRTTLLSLCLVQLALIFNGEGVGTIELLTTNISVSYHYALYTLAALIFFNSVSYIWRWFAEPQLGHDRTIVDKLDDLKQQGEHVLNFTNELKGTHRISEQLQELSQNKDPEYTNHIMHLIQMAINHAKLSIRYHMDVEKLLRRKIKAGFLRDLIFDVIVVGGMAGITLVLTFFAPINLNDTNNQITQPADKVPGTTRD